MKLRFIPVVRDKMPGMEGFFAETPRFTFSIIKYLASGKYGASAKPKGGRPFDQTTIWFGADDRPVYDTFAAAQAACEAWLKQQEQ
jgi:hypothetical protein